MLLLGLICRRLLWLGKVVDGLPALAWLLVLSLPEGSPGEASYPKETSTSLGEEQRQEGKERVKEKRARKGS